jgi:hypothetical protein
MEQAKLRWVTIIPPNVGELECQFNPAELTISKTNNWSGDTNPNFNSPFLRFGGGGSASYKLSLFFDSYGNTPPEQPRDVREYTNQLFALTLRGAGYAMFMLPYAYPPIIQFVWGKITLFAAVVETVQVSYTLFAPDGTPIRAKADVSFLQNDLTDDIIPAQNPTSRTDPRKTRIAHSRQRLDQIAYEEYGDPRYWRVLAEANGMDDPFQLVDGQILVIPQNDLS